MINNFFCMKWKIFRLFFDAKKLVSARFALCKNNAESKCTLTYTTMGAIRWMGEKNSDRLVISVVDRWTIQFTRQYVSVTHFGTTWIVKIVHRRNKQRSMALPYYFFLSLSPYCILSADTTKQKNQKNWVKGKLTKV